MQECLDFFHCALQIKKSIVIVSRSETVLMRSSMQLPAICLFNLEGFDLHLSSRKLAATCTWLTNASSLFHFNIALKNYFYERNATVSLNP